MSKILVRPAILAMLVSVSILALILSIDWSMNHLNQGGSDQSQQELSADVVGIEPQEDNQRHSTSNSHRSALGFQIQLPQQWEDECRHGLYLYESFSFPENPFWNDSSLIGIENWDCWDRTEPQISEESIGWSVNVEILAKRSSAMPADVAYEAGAVISPDPSSISFKGMAAVRDGRGINYNHQTSNYTYTDILLLQSGDTLFRLRMGAIGRSREEIQHRIVEWEMILESIDIQ